MKVSADEILVPHRATKRAYCRRHRPVAAPDTGWQSPVQQGTVVGRSRQVTATGLDPEAVLNEPIIRCLKKIGCVRLHACIGSHFLPYFYAFDTCTAINTVAPAGPPRKRVDSSRHPIVARDIRRNILSTRFLCQ